MVMYTAGELDDFLYLGESVYGTTLTSVLVWGGDLKSVRPLSDFKKEFLINSGSRFFSKSTRGPHEIGFTAQIIPRVVSGGYDWTDLFAVYGFGSASALTDHLGSFTAQISKTQSGSTFYNFYNGCKINRMSILFQAPGRPILFEPEIWAQYVDDDTDKSITGLQALTVGADPSPITTAPITWAAVSQINIAAGGLATWYPKNMRLTVEHNLIRKQGHRTGADTNKYTVAQALDEGDGNLLLEADILHEVETYTNAKHADSAVTAVTLPIGAKTITLENGEFTADDFPELKQGPMDSESVKIKFKSLSIA